ncbi:MerR family transcriptional regulator [Corynebacterium silvaticum]|uniref:MerR family transcriptional regulator n=1 Tax=Corynebacterium silvaticum TaxID=2320431 RepID=A0A7Y4LGM8_9CORY|nr:MerR family transcriptional regulator [Corynebacterium silvaticum]ARU46115.1 MerR family transcriptional regulator [Corynebacterium silvaticum]MBH5299224.1 MerR family transcriptional regulator [Corynebacterium silvaticum]NOM64457.1 MerR family transcriptional regulator [Corynebacterium silvaticum]NON69666.1 MerR family transcriptional regulator [Corynebacterium silvaticum]TFA94281.1 MerR family transcriptional regulator [Corynebacterium silvaticum]
MSALPQSSGSQPVVPGQHRPRTGNKTMSIGVVLDKLTAEFPDVTVSKIRFLEAEGLIAPKRTASGYRRFTHDDVERLRYILVTQRDNYLPLKVIREQLEAMDSGAVTPISRGGDAKPIVSPENFRAPVATRLSDHDVVERSGAELSLLQELSSAGIIRPDNSGFFTADDVQIVAIASQLKEFGFDVRHLKSLKNTASRQADFITRAATPTARSKSDGAKQRAEEMSQQMSALVVSLNATLVKTMVRNELGQ